MGVAVPPLLHAARATTTTGWSPGWSCGTATAGRLLPGYGWVFGVGDGTCNVGLGILNTSDAFGKTDYRDMLDRWWPIDAGGVGLHRGERTGPTRGAALPMGFNRTPHYADGALLVGDAGGMVNPMNGEGIAYAMESGGWPPEIVAQALARPDGARRERVLRAYPRHSRPPTAATSRSAGVFVKAIGHPSDEARDPPRHAAPDADAVLPEAAGEPDRPAGRRRQGPASSAP